MNIEDLQRLMEDQLKLSRRLKARVQELEAGQHAPLAVVGMALRLPGGLTTPEAYWRFLCGDRTAISEIPAERPGLRSVYDPRPDRLGRSYVNRAGFLDDLAGFDASFFGISQREAEALDPQQRLLLETAWEAMERAGIPVRRFDRLRAGVFVGIMASEYGERRAGRSDKTAIDPYFGTGGGHCFAAGRISYVMGFSGPAVAVDTACSSSLVALHLAAQSLRTGECRYALVGGANLLLSADLMVSLCQSKALAPDGRSKTFTAAADGYGRGEGVGMLVLMRLDEAEREGRSILAVLRGTAVNHDGASSGLTVPSGPAQQEVIRAALGDARVQPQDVGYVEAHGTGTALGDPIEVGALDAVLGSGAAGRASPLAIGSVKSRIGHLEAAAGIAGLLKLVLMLSHGEVPAALGDEDGPLNPLIAWDRLGLEVPRRRAAWPAAFAHRIAGISAFGLSGTNAHAVLGAYDRAASAPAQAPGHDELVTLSAKDAVSLKALAASVASYLGELDPAHLASACHSLRAGRTAHGQRLAVTGASPAEIAQKLTAEADALASAPPMAMMTARVRVGGDPRRLAAGIDAIARTFPRLAAALAGTPPRPEAQLERILQRLGVRAKVVTAGVPASVVAQLECSGSARPLLTEDAGAAPDLLIAAVAALFMAGADLSLDALQGTDTRFLGDLPTYPFHRKRFWIDEAVEAVEAQGHGPQGRAGGPTSLPPEWDPEAVREVIVTELMSALRAEVELDCTRTFLEVGGDSFTAMLLQKGIEQRYDVKVPLDAVTTDLPLSTLLDQLVSHIAQAVSGIDRAEKQSVA
jgi:3-oxoacyl-[acyl-carrier-protein] synthase II